MRKGWSVVQLRYRIPGPSESLYHSHREIKGAQDYQLVVLNTGEGTHLMANGSSSLIDISLASPYWATKTTWKVLNKSLGIKMTINDRVLYEDLRSTRVNLKTFESLLAETLCQLRRLHRPRHYLENHQRVERQLLRSTNPPDRLRLWVSSIPAICTHQVPASAEPRTFPAKRLPSF